MKPKASDAAVKMAMATYDAFEGEWVDDIDVFRNNVDTLAEALDAFATQVIARGREQGIREAAKVSLVITEEHRILAALAVGTCSCADDYTLRNRSDPTCIYCAVGEDVAEQIAIAEQLGIEREVELLSNGVALENEIAALKAEVQLEKRTVEAIKAWYLGLDYTPDPPIDEVAVLQAEVNRLRKLLFPQ